MVSMVERLLELNTPIFMTRDVANLLGGSADRLHGVIKRSLASGRLLRLRKGLYALPSRLGEAKLDLLSLAQHLYGPSYISLESALSYHGLIPEAVYTVTSVSQGKAKTFTTPLGAFSFQRVPQEIFFTQVERASGADNLAFFLATPLKALTDYLYCHKKRWVSLEEARRELRIDLEAFPPVSTSQVDELLMNYRNSRVCAFLQGIREEIA